MKNQNTINYTFTNEISTIDTNKNKIALVTGGTRGIGKGIAEYFLKNGYYVVVCSRSCPDNVLFPGYTQYEFMACDISNHDDRDNLVSQIIKKHQKIDVLVNNAGIAPPKRLDLLDTTESSYDLVMGINLKGPFFLTQLIANTMIDYKKNQMGENADYGPVIINISSISAYTSSTSRAEYCISKAGLSMMTMLFADRLSEFEIPVFEIRPGVIKTSMTSGVKEKYDNLIEKGIFPIKRWGLPYDIAKAAYALAQNMIPYSTGQIINIDGGFHLKRL